MGRLTQVPGRLAPMRSSLGYLPQATGQRDQDKERAAFHPYRAWYKTARWRHLRMRVLERDMFTCQLCGRVEPDTSKLVADHKRPHRGDEALFWNEAGIEAICKPCHDGAKQRAEQAREMR